MSAEQDGKRWVYPDTLVGTDSHTTMINGLGVVGWGVGGIEAEAAMLGQPCSMLIPQVVGFRLTGKLKPGATATDLVLTITQMLRKKGVVGKFVEFFGPGLAALPVADRATIGNMAPEYGATIGIFPVDEQTTAYLRLTGREALVPLVEAYYKAQGLWHTPGQPESSYSDTLELDLGTVEPSLAGPSRPQDRLPLKEVRGSFRKSLVALHAARCGEAGEGDPGTVARRRGLADDRCPGTGGTPSRPGAWRTGAMRAAAATGRRRLQPLPRFHRHCRHHQLHQYLQSLGDDRRRASGEKRGAARPAGQAVGEDEPCPRFQGGRRLPCRQRV